MKKDCLEITDCFAAEIEHLFDVQNAPLLEIVVSFIFGLLTFNLFLGLIVDSISEIR